MKKAATIAAWAVAGACCIVAAYFCHFYYVRYKTVVTELEGRINGFDMRLAALEGHKSLQLTPVRVWAVLSTSDKPPDKNIQFYLPSAKLPDGYFEAINAKGGPLVRPELRLPPGATSNCVFDIQVESQFGPVADAWLSHGSPFQELAAFDELRIYPSQQTNIFRLVARPKAGASVQLRLEIVLLCQKNARPTRNID